MLYLFNFFLCVFSFVLFVAFNRTSDILLVDHENLSDR